MKKKDEFGAPSACAHTRKNSPREEQRQPHFAQPTSVLLFPLLPKVPTTLLGACSVIKVSFIIIINIFMLIHHFRKNLHLGIHNILGYVLVEKKKICYEKTLMTRLPLL